MDYETPDGSRFSLSEVFDGEDFSYTSVSAFVKGEAFAGRLEARVEEVDDTELLSCLKAVPVDNIYPVQAAFMTILHAVDAGVHYIKSPSFLYEDSLPGQTFVARCVEREITTYELLRQQAHPQVAQYFGCIVSKGRVTQIVLQKYARNLEQHAQSGLLTTGGATNIFEDVVSAVNHLHSLGLAHNDLNPSNICIDDADRAVVIDLDSCLPFGEKLLKGVGRSSDGSAVSCKENDWRALDQLDDYLREVLGPEVTSDRHLAPARQESPDR